MSRAPVLTLLLLLGLQGPVQAQSVSGSLQVGTVVPLVCEATLEGVSADLVRADLRCNAPHRVTLSLVGSSGSAEMALHGQVRTVTPTAATASWEGREVLNGSAFVRVRDGARPADLRVRLEPR